MPPETNLRGISKAPSKRWPVTLMTDRCLSKQPFKLLENLDGEGRESARTGRSLLLADPILDLFD